MFEIERRSNLGPLVLAVLVGLLSLGSNEYARIDHRSLTEDLNQFKTSFVSAVSKSEEPAPTVEEDVRILVPQMPAIERTLSRHFQEWMSGRRAYTNVELIRSVDQVQPFRDHVDRIAAEFTLEERLTVVRLLFMASQHSSDYSDAFLKLSQEICQDADARMATQSAVLRFYHEHDLAYPQTQRLLDGLRQFSATHDDTVCSIELYSIVAKELWRHGHREVAEAVLRQGLKSFKGQTGVSRLVNQMVDQQGMPAPTQRRQ